MGAGYTSPLATLHPSPPEPICFILAVPADSSLGLFVVGVFLFVFVRICDALLNMTLVLSMVKQSKFILLIFEQYYYF